MVEGGAGLTPFLRLPAVMRERKKKKKKRVDLEEEEEGKGRSVVGPQQMLIRGVRGGWVVGLFSTKSTLRRGSTEC